MHSALHDFHILLISIAAIAVLGLITALAIGIKRERDNKKNNPL